MHKHVKQAVKALDGYPSNPIPIGGPIPEYVHTVLKHVMSNFANSSPHFTFDQTYIIY